MIETFGGECSGLGETSREAVELALGKSFSYTNFAIK